MSLKPAVFYGVKSYDRDQIASRGYTGAVDRTHDGDTFLAIVDLGVEEFPMKWVRIFNVMAPELHEEGGPEAEEALIREMPAHQLVYLEPLYKSFERWVNVVRLSPHEEVLGEILVRKYPDLFKKRGPLSKGELKETVGTASALNDLWKEEIKDARRRDNDQLKHRRKVG